MSIVRQDTFTRANVSSGWGTATDGNVWTIQSGNGQSVSGNEGIVAGSTASTFATLGAALAGADAEGLVRLTFDSNSTSPTAGIILRWTDSSNLWLCRFNGASNVINLMVKVAGTYTSLTPTYSFIPNPGTAYWLRYRAQGTTHSFRIWQDGTTEPSSWQVSITNTSQDVAGMVGLYGFADGTGTHYDHFSVDDLAASTTPVTVSDSATGAEALSFATITETLSDTASGSDVASLPGTTTAVPVSDSATGADVYTETGIVETDTAAGSEPPITVGVIAPAISDTASGTNAVGFAQAGTGIGDLTVTTKNQTWTGGPAGSPGIETNVTYKDPTGSGWSLGLIASYGGMPISSWYEVDAGGFGVNQTSLSTSVPDGYKHWLEQSSGGVYAGSEDGPFALVELAPAGTGFRRYYKTTFGPDINGFNWTAYACIYPGDPGLVFYRFDCTNPGASAIALSPLATGDAMEIALIGGMQQADATWVYTNGYYGTLGGANTQWPVASSTGNPVLADPDYVYITPAAGNGVSIGQLTVKQKSSSNYSPAWTNQQISVLQNTSRMKIKLQSDTPTSFPANTTSTIYLLGALRRSLTSADAIAIAADYINAGTPTAASGSFTSFSYDEGAFVFAAAAGNILNATLDLSPAHVTARFKPRYKVTNWTSTAAPNVTWGGSALVAGSDYRYLIDTTNNILYLQLYFDVVASGAGLGQRVNAALNIAPSNVAPAPTDSAVGAESAALATIAPAVNDSASGAETATLAPITPAVSESALGSESLGSIGLTLPSDSALGAESVGLTAATPSVSDTALGDDSQLSLGTITPSVSDTALGDDSGIAVSSAIPLSASDSATGAESAALGTITPAVSESASGAEQLTPPSVTTAIGDSATGSEATALAETLATSDSAIGADSAALGQIALSTGDSGSESAQIALSPVVVTPPGDSATGSDQVSQATALGASDSATGSDQATLGQIAPLVSDTATGAEQTALGAVSLTPPTETAAGAEQASVTVALVQPVVPDSAAGAESAALGVVGVSASDAALGAESATLGPIAPSVAESAQGAETPLAFAPITPSASDAASGSEAFAPGITSAPQADGGSGSEQLAFGMTTTSVSDTAQGVTTEALGSATPTLGDSALGVESVTQGATVAPSVADSALGSGDEALAATVAMPVGESGAGNETLDFSSATITAGVSDTAAGSESAPTLAPIAPSAADSALGVEGPLTFGVVAPAPSDSAIGIEGTPTLLVAPNLPDSALGSEGVSTSASALAPSDSAVGSETLGGAQVTLAPSDSATGSENAPQIAASLALAPDDALGSESGPALLIAPALAESATGAEALAEATTLGVAESAAGAETLTQGAVTPSVSDSAAGAEGIALFEAGPPLTDSATGSEAVASVNLTLQPITLADQAAGTQSVALEAPLAVEGVAVTLYARDATVRITTTSASAPLTTRDATATLSGI